MPILVIVFVVTYWIIGIKNYHYNYHTAAEEGEGGSSLWLVLGLIVALVAVFAALFWWIYPRVSSKLQRKKKTTW